MTLDPNILREAQEVLKLYSTPAQELIKQNLYGPREARFAGAIIANSFTVEVHHEPTETELLKDCREGAWEQIQTLCDLLRKTSALIEESVAGHETLLAECETEIATAEENFEVFDEEDTAKEGRSIYVIVFPALDLDGRMATTTAIDDLVKKLSSRGVAVWVADEDDHKKRVKAMTIREIYNIGRVAAVVLSTADGIVLDGWYNGALPWVEEVMTRIAELRA